MQWQHEMRITGTTETIFIITEEQAKNHHERIVPLNAVAKSIINRYRGQTDTVFHLKGGKPLEKANNRAWRNARTQAGFEAVGVHDLRYAFTRGGC